MAPLSNMKGLDIYPTADEKFELVPCVQFFKTFKLGDGHN